MIRTKRSMAALVALGIIAFQGGAAPGPAPSGADAAQLVWLDLGEVPCTGDMFVPAGTLDGYHTYRLYVRMQVEDSVNFIATGPFASAGADPTATSMFFPEAQPFQHPAGGNTPPDEVVSRAAAEAGICLDADSYFVLGEPGAQMFFINEPSPADWGAALDVVWLGIPKQFGKVDPTLFGDDARYGWVMQIVIPPGTPVTGQMWIGFGDAQLGTRNEMLLFDIPPLPAADSTGRSIGLPGRPEGAPAVSTPDVNGDAFVDAIDVRAVLDVWGKCDEGCVADLDDNGKVDHRDLAQVLRALGYEPKDMSKQAWRRAMAFFNEGELERVSDDRTSRRARKDFKRLRKAAKG